MTKKVNTRKNSNFTENEILKMQYEYYIAEISLHTGNYTQALAILAAFVFGIFQLPNDLWWLKTILAIVLYVVVLVVAGESNRKIRQCDKQVKVTYNKLLENNDFEIEDYPLEIDHLK